MSIKIDWDNGRRQGRITGDHFDEIRERFSVTNQAAKFARWRGRFMPSRTYAITPAGRFERWCRSKSSAKTQLQRELKLKSEQRKIQFYYNAEQECVNRFMNTYLKSKQLKEKYDALKQECKSKSDPKQGSV